MTAAPLLPEIRVTERADAAETRAFLERDRLLAAYALADIDPAAGDPARWWLAYRGDEPVACALLVEVLPFRPCFVTGEPEAVATILRESLREPRIVVAGPTPCRLAIESVYRFERCDRMQRMVVDARSFRPRVSHDVVRLGPERVGDVVDLYGHVSRSYFTTERLAREIYFGAYAGGTLVAAAGTHVRSRAASVAAVGNVLTRVSYRGRGMATSVTSAVTEAALEDHRDVVLNVRQDNHPAVAVYQRLGYRTHAPFIEGPALRRAAWDRLTTKIFGRGNV
ncbi:MAG TPA: GNAT family N-acetyltransferase [Candidatus Limnocylindria bacterium]|nr:GNAT family N-acetyltransferase [Candidatus Limnocylindria bacterium]